MSILTTASMNNSLLANQVKQALCELHTSVERLVKALEPKNALGQSLFFCPISGEPLTQPGVEALSRALTTWDIPVDSADGSVTRYPGAVEVDGSVIEIARQVNTKKSLLEALVKSALKDGVTPHQMRLIYRACEFPRIHPLQAWRKINILEGDGLYSIGFTVAKSLESIEVMTPDQAIDYLIGINAADVAIQLQESVNITKVHLHQPVSPHLRANVTWKPLLGDVRRSMLHASLPFLIPIGGWPTKRVRFNQPRKHNRRADRRNGITLHIPNRSGAFILAT